jgi:hypothetical protein
VTPIAAVATAMTAVRRMLWIIFDSFTDRWC